MIDTRLHCILKGGTIDNSNRRLLHKLQTFLRFAFDLSRLSTCKRAQVGCLIVPHDFSEVLSIGINGPSRGRANNACTNVPKNCGCVHAEANALAKLTSKVPSIALCTCAPCVRCAGVILNVKTIEAVVFVQRNSGHKEGEDVLNNAMGLCPAYHYDLGTLGELDDTHDPTA